MVHDVYVFGDSHWRVFFPFINHGAATDNISHEGEHDGVKVRTIDTIANELSGATMWGLLNPNSKNGARNRVLNTIDSLGGVRNVGLVFGEVDARYHNERYHIGDSISFGRILELVSRYVRFIQEDLMLSGRVTGMIFVYHGFAYPKGEHTLLQPGQPIGHNISKANAVNAAVGKALLAAFSGMACVRLIQPSGSVINIVSADGVHLDPRSAYEQYTLPTMAQRWFYDKPRQKRELPL